MKAVPFSPARVGLIAHNTVLEAARQKLFHVLLILALGLVLGARWFRDFNLGAPELKFLADCGFGAMTFFGAALTISAAAQLFFSEIENRTALTLLAKPVWRMEFILGKFLGIVVVVAVFCALLTALLIGVLWSRETELMRDFPEYFPQGRTVSYANILLAGGLQWLKLAVLASFALLVASFAQTQLFTVIAGFCILVICHLQYLAQDAYARGEPSLGRTIGGALARVFPNFQVFTLADSISALDNSAPVQVARVTLYGFGYALAACLLAVFSFRKREI